MALTLVVIMLFHVTGLSLWQTLKRLEDLTLIEKRLNILRDVDSIRNDLMRLEDAENWYQHSKTPEYKKKCDNLSLRVRSQLVQLSNNLPKRYLPEYQQIKQLVDVRLGPSGQMLLNERSAETKAETDVIDSRISALSKDVETDYHQRDAMMEQGALQTATGLVFTVFVMVLVLSLLMIFVKKYVSERTMRRQNLLEAETKFRAVFNQTFQFAGLLSREGLVVETNQAALEFAGVTSEDVAGSFVWETPWWSHSEESKSKLKAAVIQASGGETVRLEGVVKGKNRKAAVELSVRPVTSEDGDVAYLVAESRDISAMKQAREALAEQEARMRALVETASDGIITFKTDGTIESVNPAIVNLLGYDEAEMIGAKVDKLIDPSIYLPYGQDGIPTERILGIETELFAVRKDGGRVPIEIAVGLIELEDANNLFTGIIRDVSERKESENRLKEFYSTVSHELRTPLAAIRTALGLLENSSEEKKFQSIVDIATEEADRLIRMVNDILDIRRIEAGKLNLTIETTNVKRMVERSVNSVQSLAEQAGVELKSSIDEDVELQVDLDRIHQVLTNLISNAIKFAPRQSSVIVSTRATEEMIIVEVADEGPGVPPEESEKIFGRFEQLVSREERSQGGTGLGLAIAKGIVENHGGKIGVTSRANGSTFWFELPLD